MNSDKYEDLSVMIVSFLTLKIIFMDVFLLNNFEVETRWYKINKTKKQ